MEYSVDHLVRLAKRENNVIRPYLFVNPLQGKHIPTNPQDTIDMCQELAAKVNEAYPDDLLYVIGFAETATGIAACVASFLKNAVFYQNTTRESNGGDNIYFSEVHSHATDQLLRAEGIEHALQNIYRVIFIDDEVTTGNTICNLISALKTRSNIDELRFTIASVLNSMSEDRYFELQGQGIDCLFLNRIPYEYNKDSIMDVQFDPDKHIYVQNFDESIDYSKTFTCPVNPRNLVSFHDYMSAVREYAEEIRRTQYAEGTPWNRVLVIGTEEFMFPTFIVGEMIRQQGYAKEVKIHSTTRSPIIASDKNGYPLWCRYQIRSSYDAHRQTYIYNLEKYDKVFVLTDSNGDSIGLGDLRKALNLTGNKDIAIFRWQYSKEGEKI